MKDNASEHVKLPSSGVITVIFYRPNDAGFIGKGHVDWQARRLIMRGDRTKLLPANCCFMSCLDPFFCSSMCCLVDLLFLPMYLLSGLLLAKAQEHVINLATIESFSHQPGMLKLTYREGDRIKALGFKPFNAEEGFQLLAWLEQELPGMRAK